jgi:GTP cyclohydrolase II
LARQATLGNAAERGGGGDPDEDCDPRDISVGSAILTDFGVRSIRILTDHPHQIHALDGHDLLVAEQIPLHGLRQGSAT